MKLLFPLLMVIILAGFAYIGVEGMNLQTLFGIYLPYVAAGIFIIGVVCRVIRWGCSPVPFRIPTTCGQQKSLPWLNRSPLENPSNFLEVAGRMAGEIIFFRSLFRNTQTILKKDEPRLIHEAERYLWIGALAFHYSFLIVVIRHFRLFIEPIPPVLSLICTLDGFVQVGSPVICITGLVLLAAACFLLLRRIIIPRIRYISLPADYFPLFLIIAIAGSGILMRHLFKVDVISIKAFILSLFNFQPVLPTDIGAIFYIHFFLVCVLLIYFPFSKLIHLAGVFFSPARNMANNNRMKRHINPWNYPVHVHTYEEYEDDFRGKMKQVGIPVEKDV